MNDFFDRMVASQADQQVEDSNTEPDNIPAASQENTDNRAPATAVRVKQAVQELMKYGYLGASRRPNLYQQSVTARQEINQILEPLDLKLKIDDIRGLAFLVVSQLWQGDDNHSEETDEWSHPLVRRQRITMEQSLLIAILRQQYITHEQEAGIGASDATVDVEELLSQLQIYLGDMGSDSRERKRLDNLIDKLSSHGLVAMDDKQETITIRPMITHLANPESLLALLNHFKRVSELESKGSAIEERTEDNL